MLLLVIHYPLETLQQNHVITLLLTRENNFILFNVKTEAYYYAKIVRGQADFWGLMPGFFMFGVALL